MRENNMEILHQNNNFLMHENNKILMRDAFCLDPANQVSTSEGCGGRRSRCIAAPIFRLLLLFFR
jgi:hypothetical protein